MGLWSKLLILIRHHRTTEELPNLVKINTMHQRIIFTIFFLYLAGLCDGNYCELWDQHVLCVNPPNGDACGDDFLEVVPDAEQQQAIVDWHNEMRQKVALGQELRGENETAQPPAANMMKMQWDPELAKIAQSSANQCLYKHDCKECRRVLGGRFSVGQSIVKQGSSNISTFDFTKPMVNWYDEVTMVHPDIVESYIHGEYGHYTQIAWWNTRSIGCGGASYRSLEDPKKRYFLIFCDYGAGANLRETKIYATGEACSQCPNETKCDSTYNGLCSITKTPFNVEELFPTDQVYLGLDEGTYIVI